jgi:hypothetical protein
MEGDRVIDWKEELDDALTMLHGPAVEVVPATQKVYIDKDGQTCWVTESPWVKFGVMFSRGKDSMNAKLDGGQVKTFIAIALRIGDSQDCWPSVETIAEDSGQSVKTVQRHLYGWGGRKGLMEHGLVEVVERAGKTNVYTVARYASYGQENPLQPPVTHVGGTPDTDDTPDTHDGGTPVTGDGLRRTKEEEPTLPPIGGDGASHVVVEHDLEEVGFLMEGTGQKKDDLQAACPECGAAHFQDMNACPDCGAHVVWHNSRVWKKLYGNSKDYSRSMTQDLKPETPLQVEACQKIFKGHEFPNITAKRKFKSLERNTDYPDRYLRELIEWAKNKKFKSFVSAVKNKDNYDDWMRRNVYEPTREPEGMDDDYQPSGWEILALRAAEEENVYGTVYGDG